MCATESSCGPSKWFHHLVARSCPETTPTTGPGGQSCTPACALQGETWGPTTTGTQHRATVTKSQRLPQQPTHGFISLSVSQDFRGVRNQNRLFTWDGGAGTFLQVWETSGVNLGDFIPTLSECPMGAHGDLGLRLTVGVQSIGFPRAFSWD